MSDGSKIRSVGRVGSLGRVVPYMLRQVGNLWKRKCKTKGGGGGP